MDFLEDNARKEKMYASYLFAVFGIKKVTASVFQGSAKRVERSNVEQSK